MGKRGTASLEQERFLAGRVFKSNEKMEKIAKLDTRYSDAAGTISMAVKKINEVVDGVNTINYTMELLNKRLRDTEVKVNELK